MNRSRSGSTQRRLAEGSRPASYRSLQAAPTCAFRTHEWIWRAVRPLSAMLLSMRPTKLLLLAAVLPTLSGCALLRQLLNTSYGPPSASFTSATIQEASLDGARVEVRFSLDNP